jgi:hypothetical protein
VIITVLFWICISLLTFLYGSTTIKLLQRFFKITSEEQPSLILQWLLGIIVLTTAASFLSLVIPVGWLAHTLLLAGGLLSLCLQWKKIRAYIEQAIQKIKGVHWLVWVICGLILVISLDVGTRIPANSDTGQYHAQAIRWIETYRVVPGLGNLLTRFAINSSWLVTNALFSLSFLGGRSFHLVPSALFLAASLYSAFGISSLLKKQYCVSNFFKAFLLPFAFAMIASEVSSPGTDLPVILFCWIIFAEWLAMSEQGAVVHRTTTSVLWVLTVFCVTMKLSSVIVAAGGVYLLLSKKEYRNFSFLGINIGLAFLLLIPWLVRNVILSGYLIYPFPYIDLFHFDWKIPMANALSDMHSIQNWARFPHASLGVQNRNTFASWVPAWWANQTVFRRTLLLVTACMPPLCVILEWVLLKTKRIQKSLGSPYLPVAAFAYLGVGFWLFTAPDFRFGWGFIIPAFLILAGVFLVIFSNIATRVFSIFRFFYVFLVILFLGYTLLKGTEFRTIPQRILLPADYPQLPTEPCRLQNATVLMPAPEAWSDCWYAPFPCTFHCEAGIEMRGASWQSGFRWPESNP